MRNSESVSNVFSQVRNTFRKIYLRNFCAAREKEVDGRRAPHVLSSEYKNPHGCFLDKVVRSIGLIIGNRVCARRKKKKKRERPVRSRCAVHEGCVTYTVFKGNGS